MNSSTGLVTGCGLLLALAWGCTSVDRSGPDSSAGGSDPSETGGAVDVAGSSGTSAGHGSTAGRDSAAGAAGAVAGRGGASAGGASAGGASAGAESPGGASTSGDGGTSEGGTAGIEVGSGDAGMGGQGPLVLLKNPSFELGVLAGWQAVVSPANVGKAVYTQWGSATGESIDGMYEVSFWNGTAAFTGDLHQTVTGLTPGKYELKVYAAFGNGLNAAYLYAIGCGPADARVDLPIADTVPTFAPFSIPSIDVTEDTCTVGLFVDSNIGNWLNADAFVFDKVVLP